MAKSPLFLLLSLISIAITLANSSTPTPTNFIQNSCTITTYPALCVQSLSVYASTIQHNIRQLTQTALSVSLTKAQWTKKFVSKMGKFKGLKKREYEAILDCVDEMGDTVDRLSKSVSELKNIGDSKGQEFLWHMSNVETWVSAALTDENTCVDGFSGKLLDGKIKNSIKLQIVKVAQVTSNALALINQFAAKH